MARSPATPELTLTQLKQLLAKREGELARLYRKRTSLQQRLAAVEQQIQELGGSGANGNTGRARNDRSLVDAMESVIRKAGRPMKVSEIADAVLATGYQSNSVNFRVIVNQMLIKDKRFTQTGERGMYSLK